MNSKKLASERSFTYAKFRFFRDGGQMVLELIRYFTLQKPLPSRKRLRDFDLDDVIEIVRTDSPRYRELMSRITPGKNWPEVIRQYQTSLSQTSGQTDLLN